MVNQVGKKSNRQDLGRNVEATINCGAMSGTFTQTEFSTFVVAFEEYIMR